MKPEEKVSSLELSKKLKELGVKQESSFYWIENKESKNVLLAFKTLIGFYTGEGSGFADSRIESCNIYSAFTVSELGEILPMEIKRNYYFETTRMAFANWLCGYYKDHKKYYYQVLGKTESDARANMLRFLIENNLIKI